MNFAPTNGMPLLTDSLPELMDQMSTALLILDDQMRLLQMNDAAEHLLEISGRLSKGQPLSELIREGEEIIQVLKEALNLNQTFTARKASFGLHSNGEITVDYTITPIGDREQASAVLLEIYPLSRYLRIDRDELLRSHQETTRQMIRGLAHEVKNPLGGIRGAAQLLARELGSEELNEFTSIIIEETDRLADLVDRMLGPNTLPLPSPANIHELLEKILRLAEVEVRGQIAFHRDYDPSIPEIDLDQGLMTQAILNILRNAMQSLQNTHAPEISISTRTERQFTIGNTRYRLVLRLAIEDNGPGIPPELQDQLFFPMISGRPDGTGLGLPLAQSIVHQHDGLIEFESEPGRTSFTLIIPLKSDSEKLK